jgi:hypothetical protein
LPSSLKRFCCRFMVVSIMWFPSLHAKSLQTYIVHYRTLQSLCWWQSTLVPKTYRGHPASILSWFSV